MASCTARVQAMYSASVDNSASVTWSLLLQLMAAPLIKKTYPLVDCRVSTLPAQSASVYPRISEVRLSELLLLYWCPYSFVPVRYHRM